MNEQVIRYLSILNDGKRHRTSEFADTEPWHNRIAAAAVLGNMQRDRLVVVEQDLDDISARPVRWYTITGTGRAAIAERHES